MALSKNAFVTVQMIQRVASGATHTFYFCSSILKLADLTDCSKVTRRPKAAHQLRETVQEKNPTNQRKPECEYSTTVIQMNITSNTERLHYATALSSGKKGYSAECAHRYM